jgi:hypothetical protein
MLVTLQIRISEQVHRAIRNRTSLPRTLDQDNGYEASKESGRNPTCRSTPTVELNFEVRFENISHYSSRIAEL